MDYNRIRLFIKDALSPVPSAPSPVLINGLVQFIFIKVRPESIREVKLCIAKLPGQETQKAWAWSLGQEGPLEEERATHSNILAWKIPWTEEPSGLQYMECTRVRHD